MALTKSKLKEIVAMLKEQAELQAKINGSFEGYVSGLKDAKKLTETISRNDKIISDVRIKLADAVAAGNAAEEEKQQDILDILEKQNKLLNDRKDIMVANLKEVNKTNLLLAKGTAELVKGILSIPAATQKLYREFKGYGLFDMDKSIKQSALSMGLLTAQSKQFSKNVQAAAMNTTSFGVGAQELAKMQADYSEELGRSVMLDKTGLEAVAKIAAATGLGAEGTAKMAADMEQQGISAERTASFVEQTMQDSASMGLNATKVIKNIQGNIKLLNKYNFKDGIKGLEKMAQSVAKLGIDMNAVGPMADKLFDIEGAVDMSAQLQVMGGAWAKLADPFKLMYTARNDMGALVEEIGKATEASVTFNKQKGDFEISALEMHRLRKVAEQTGIAYETLAEAGKNARKQTEVKSQVSIAVDEKTKEFLANTAKFDEHGRAYIEISGEPKYLDALTSSDAIRLKTQQDEKKSLEKYAKDSRTFDDALSNTVDMFKTAMLPIVTQIDKKLIPKIEDFVKNIKESKWIDKVGSYVGKIADIITTGLGWFIDHPKTTAAIVGLGVIIPTLFEKAGWIANGLLLAEGFNLGMGLPTSGVAGMAKNFMSYLGGEGAAGGIGSMAMQFAKVAGPLLGAAAGTYLGMSSGKSISQSMGYKSSTGGDVAGVLGGVAGGAAGWGVGAALAPETFGLSLLIPALAAALGAYGGSTLGKAGGDIVTGNKINDGYSPSIVDNINESAGTQRSILAGGQIHPIDDADSFITKKPHGPVDKSVAGDRTTIVKHEFGDININGQVMVTGPGGANIGIDLMKNPEFIRGMTTMITVEMQKNKNQVQHA